MVIVAICGDLHCSSRLWHWRYHDGRRPFLVLLGPHNSHWKHHCFSGWWSRWFVGESVANRSAFVLFFTFAPRECRFIHAIGWRLPLQRQWVPRTGRAKTPKALIKPSFPLCKQVFPKKALPIVGWQLPDVWKGNVWTASRNRALIHK